MKNQHAACLAFVLLSAMAFGIPGCSSGDDSDAPESAAGVGGSLGSGGRAGGGGSTARAGSGQVGAGGNRCLGVTPVSGESCQSLDDGRFCPAENGEPCICTEQQQQQQRGRQQQGRQRVWVCFGGIPPEPAQGGSGGSAGLPLGGAPSESGAGGAHQAGAAAGGEPSEQAGAGGAASAGAAGGGGTGLESGSAGGAAEGGAS